MRNVVVEDAAAAVEGIKDGDAVMMGGFGGAGFRSEWSRRCSTGASAT